jgi:hypothetical protein
VVVNLGYGFLFAPPGYRGSVYLHGSVSVGLLAVEIAAACLVLGAVYVIATVKRKEGRR